MRSIVLITPRWMITGRCSALSSPMYLRPNCSGRWKSTWMVDIVSSRPSQSRIWMSIFGP